MSGLPTSGNTPEGSRRFSNQCSGHYAHLTPDFYLPKKIPGEMETLTLVLRLIKYVIFSAFQVDPRLYVSDVYFLGSVQLY